MKRIAIYARKSKYMKNSTSTANQIKLCKAYAKKHFDSIEEFIIYEDEGFSGGHLDRPAFQKMIHGIKNKYFHLLICYRLDRISRNIMDFFDIIKLLKQQNIQFLSIKEQFNTHTHLGNAMMYMACVFAQLERESTAQRVKDNMLELSKLGVWLGGTTPIGFESKEVSISHCKREKKIHILEPIEEELKMVKILYNEFLKTRSLEKVKDFSIQNNIRTKNHLSFTRFSLRYILSNPVYAIADLKLYDYFIKKGYSLYNLSKDFDGKHGIMAYNKTLQRKHFSTQLKDPCEWVISVGHHEGIIKSHVWIHTQNLLLENQSSSLRKAKNSYALLSGLLYCKICGHYMKPKKGKVSKNGIQNFYYICEGKEKSKKKLCNVKNINGIKIDDKILKSIQNLDEDVDVFYQSLSNVMNDFSFDTLDTPFERITQDIDAKQSAIHHLVYALAQNPNPSAQKHILKKISILKQEKKVLLHTFKNLKSISNKTPLPQNHPIDLSFSKVLMLCTIHQKRDILKSLIKKITWDGQTIDVFFKSSP